MPPSVTPHFLQVFGAIQVAASQLCEQDTFPPEFPLEVFSFDDGVLLVGLLSVALLAAWLLVGLLSVELLTVWLLVGLLAVELLAVWLLVGLLSVTLLVS